jgi:hypothetical protein
MQACVLENDGAGNLILYLLDGQTAYASQGRIPSSASLTWAGGITNLSATYAHSVSAEIATASSGTHAAFCFVISCGSSL